MAVVPQNSLERSFAVCVAALAMVVNPFIVSKITSSMVALENLQREQTLTTERLKAYLHRHGISDELRMRVRNVANMKNTDSNAVLIVIRKLPLALAVELKVEIMGPLLRKHALLRVVVKGGNKGSAEVHTLAADGADDRVLSGGQKLFSVGQEAHHLHFVLRGELTYQMKQVNSFRLVETGDWLSEQALWLSVWQHMGVAASQKGSVELLSISAKVFQRSFADSLVLKRYAAVFLESLGLELKTDIGNAHWTEEVLKDWLRECTEHGELRSSEPEFDTFQLPSGTARSSKASQLSSPQEAGLFSEESASPKEAMDAQGEQQIVFMSDERELFDGSLGRLPEESEPITVNERDVLALSPAEDGPAEGFGPPTTPSPMRFFNSMEKATKPQIVCLDDQWDVELPTVDFLPEPSLREDSRSDRFTVSRPPLSSSPRACFRESSGEAGVLHANDQEPLPQLKF